MLEQHEHKPPTHEFDGITETRVKSPPLYFSVLFYGLILWGVLFTREDYPYISGLNALQGKSVAAVSGYSITDILARDYPKLKLILMDTTLEAMNAVAVGQADAFIDTLAVGIYYIRKQNLANLKVAAPAKVPPRNNFV